MNSKTLLCVVSALALAASGAAQTQSLPELAKQEKLRRAKLRAASGPTKVYTEGDRSTSTADLVALDTATLAPTDGAAPGAAPASKEKTREELAAERQKEWADKVKVAQDEIKSLEEVIARNERSLASMYNITPARQDMVNAIEADKKKVQDLRQTLANLEEERRRAGMPRQ